MSNNPPLRYSHNHHLLAVKGCEAELDVLAFVVHGVLPDRGAPIAYKRMKAGEAGPVGLVIGSSGAEMTPVLAQSPGPLQLLPGYGYGMGWFHVEGLKQPLPQTNPYTEIYTLRSVWWGLCEERLINPENKDMDKTQLEKDWQSYVDNIDNKVRTFIEGLNGRYHEHTYAFYGNDGKKYPSYAELHWKDVSGKYTPEAYRSQVSEQGEYSTRRTNLTRPFAMQRWKHRTRSMLAANMNYYLLWKTVTALYRSERQ
jgi:hypothetical protein